MTLSGIEPATFRLVAQCPTEQVETYVLIYTSLYVTSHSILIVLVLGRRLINCARKCKVQDQVLPVARDCLANSDRRLCPEALLLLKMRHAATNIASLTCN